MEFIHTFSAETYLTSSQVERMIAVYGKEFFPPDNKKYVFSKYARHGFRMEVVYADKKVKQYDKEHRSFKATWIITPAKLLYPGEPMQKLYAPDEYAEVCNVLRGILDEIKKDSGVDLLREAKIRRVDVTKDIETSSESYSKDVIHGHDTSAYTGLLRFELSLKRAFMKRHGYITEEYLTMENLSFTLGCIVRQANELLYKYMITPYCPGKMLSKERQKKFFKRYCGSKQQLFYNRIET